MVFIITFHLFALPTGSNASISINDNGFTAIFKFIVACIIAPFFETLILQSLLYKLIHDHMKLSNSLYIILAAIAFGLFHYKPYWTSIPIALFAGLTFNYLYVVLLKIKTRKQAFLNIFSIHAVVNFLAFLLKTASVYFLTKS